MGGSDPAKQVAARRQRLTYAENLRAVWRPSRDRLAALTRLYADEVIWHGPHPLNDCVGKEAVFETLWRPLLTALPDLERRDEIVLAGHWQGHSWAAATGYYVGNFAADWLGIPATRQPLYIRFGEFARLEEGSARKAM